MHSGAIPSSVTKLVLAFGHCHTSAIFNAIHNNVVFLADLNLSVIESIPNFIASNVIVG